MNNVSTNVGASGGPEHTGLRAGALGLFEDTVASVANVAPSSTVAFTLALLVSFAGLASPLAVLVAGILMLLCAAGYSRFIGTSPNGFSGLADAGVICGFLYAGWEVPLILSEETPNRTSIPAAGRSWG
jgi:hypothetical protein